MAESKPESNARSSLRESQYNAFVKLLARHDQAIRRFVRSLLPSQDGVEDVVQETALECWNKFADFRPSSAESVDAGSLSVDLSNDEKSDEQHSNDEFVRWACVIARFKALSWQRDRVRDRLVFRESVFDRLADSSLDHLKKSDRERAAIESCLNELPSDQRRLVLSVHVPGDSVAKIAAETGGNSRRLYSRVNSLRKLLFGCVRKRMTAGVGHA